MLDRFQGSDGRRHVVEALAAQTLVQGSEEIARALADAAEIVGCDAGRVIIEQHDASKDLYLILAGSFTITVNGREVAQRQARASVGEMSLTDPASRRSATVIAREESVVAKISEPAFARIADEHPILWRRIAAELAERLRQRNTLVRIRNDIPRLFVGSSTESVAIANAIQNGLSRDPVEVDVWSNGVFGPSEFALESLEREAQRVDFAALVLGPDDRIRSRHMERNAPRDNVVLEIGLFIGTLGHSRVFMVVPTGMDVKIPTDLLGITLIQYAMGSSKGLAQQMRAVCGKLRAAIGSLGPK